MDDGCEPSKNFDEPILNSVNQAGDLYSVEVKVSSHQMESEFTIFRWLAMLTLVVLEDTMVLRELSRFVMDGWS